MEGDRLRAAMQALECRFAAAGIPPGTVGEATLAALATAPVFAFHDLFADTLWLYRRHAYRVADGSLAWSFGGGLAWFSDEMDGDQILVQILGARSSDV